MCNASMANVYERLDELRNSCVTSLARVAMLGAEYPACVWVRRTEPRTVRDEFDGLVLARCTRVASTEAATTPQALSRPESDTGSHGTRLVIPVRK